MFRLCLTLLAAAVIPAAQAQLTADQRAAMIQDQLARGNYDNAIAEARDWLQGNVTNVRARLLLGTALIAKHNYADAHIVIDQLAKEQPRLPDVVFQVAVLALDERRFEDADAAFTKGRGLDPGNLRWLYGLVESQLGRNRADDALALLERESATIGTNPGFLILYGNTSARAGKFAAAVDLYRKALDQQTMPDAKIAGDLWLRIGEAQRRAGDLPAAIESLRNARTLLPENPVVATTLALTLDAALRRNEAIEAYEAAFKLQPDNPIVLNNLAFRLSETPADLDRALTMAQRAKQLQPKSPEVADTLAVVYVRKKMFASAVEMLRELVAAEPSRATYHLHYAQALEGKGDADAALKEYQAARALKPTETESQEIDAAISRMTR